MDAASTQFFRKERALKEIERTVAHARETQTILSVDECSRRIERTCPGSGLSLQQIAEALVRKSALAGVEVEFGQGAVASNAEGGTAPQSLVGVISAERSEAVSRELLFEEIARIVAAAKSSGEVVRAGYHAGMLAAAYPGANFSIGRIIDEIILAAAGAALAVDMDRRPPGAASGLGDSPGR